MTNIFQGDPDLTPGRPFFPLLLKTPEGKYCFPNELLRVDSKYWIINDQYVKHRQNEAGGSSSKVLATSSSCCWGCQSFRGRDGCQCLCRMAGVEECAQERHASGSLMERAIFHSNMAAGTSR